MTPSTVWHQWSPDPLVLGGIAVAAALYAHGVSALWQGGARRTVGRGVAPWQAGCFAGGLLSLAVALVSPVDAMAHALLSAHMAQHFLLIMVAAPLLVLGSPGIVMAAAAPPSWRRTAHRAGHAGLVHGPKRIIMTPLATWLIALAALWVWHLPSLYDAALEHRPVHVLEHLLFLGSALLFWWTAIAPGGRRRLARGADVLYVFTGGFQGAVLGALFVFASTSLYPFYSAARTAPWGLTPVGDQQMAGAVMWVPSGVVYLVIAGLLFVRWLRAMERDMRRAEGRERTVAGATS
jgi:cytochrome c oxidase assembly factor CtaG